MSARASAGHGSSASPGQNSAGSQTISPVPLSRHKVPADSKLSAGQAASAAPEHTSSGSHRSPEPGLQTIPAAATLSAGQVASAVPGHSSSGSQTSPVPALQTVVADSKLSAGQATSAAPEHTSSGSHRSPEPGLQTVPAVATLSAGQVALDPSQNSSGSHRSPEPARHTVVAGSRFSWQFPSSSQVSGLSQVRSDWSPQAVPRGETGFEHRPVTESQTPGSWQSSDAEQTTGSEPLQMPISQLSVWVQASPSSQGVPRGETGSEHVPVTGSQIPASWHWSNAVQTTPLD